MKDMTAAERALYLGRRLRAAQALYPELISGVCGRGRPKLDHEREAFLREEARRHGVSERTIARYLYAYSALGEAILVRVLDTNLDSLTSLETIKATPKHNRQTYVKQHLRGKRTRRRKIELVPLEGHQQ